jgi:hypothetical protein
LRVNWFEDELVSRIIGFRMKWFEDGLRMNGFEDELI